jgi:DNA-binding LacI/PurR family transcriptional regulator
MVTVSRVNNEPGTVVPATRARVEAAIRELGYIPNLAARTIRTNATRTIGFLVPDLTSWTNATVAQAAERRLAEAGYGLLLVSSDFHPDREVRALSVLRTRQVDGIMLYVCDQDEPNLRVATGAIDVPTITLDRAIPAPGDRVLSEHAPAMQQAVAYLRDLGHRRIGLLMPRLRIRPGIERRAAFLAACSGLEAEVMEVAPGEEPALAAFMTRNSAVIVEGSRLLLATLREARARQMRIPDDLSIVGIDAEDIALAAQPEITRIVRDFGAIGSTAAELMLARLADPGRAPVTIELPSSLVLAGSCGPTR